MRRSVSSKPRLKTIALILVFISTAVGTARFCHHATKGFRLSKIRSNLTDGMPALATEQERAFTEKLFEQKFHYLGRGLQSFVFESEDGHYVLKLFNNRYQEKIALFSFLSHFPGLGRWACKRSHYFQEKLSKTFNSYAIAFDEMQDKTGLLYIHLSPTSNLPQRLQLLDPLFICHELNPNEIGFLIQKKAELVYPALKKYLNSKDIDGAKRALSSLIELFFWKWRHAIADNDPLIRTNYGFVEGKAIQIDVGPLSKMAAAQSFEENHKQIEKITASLKFWLTENAPELTAFLDQELLQQLSL